MENKRKVSSIFKKAKEDGKRPRYIARGDAVSVDKRVYRPPIAPRCKLPPPDILSKKSALHLRSSDVVEDRGNRFVEHVATMNGPDDIPVVLNAIKYSLHAIATATHNIWGARIQVNQSVSEYSDDDGEHGGVREIIKELQRQNLVNHRVMVTRWASSVQLGRKIFDIIANCTKAVAKNYLAKVQTGASVPSQVMNTSSTSNTTTHSARPVDTRFTLQPTYSRVTQAGARPTSRPEGRHAPANG
jgi:putative IMPACT (imprinted ancient) family translation regulator